MPALNIILNGEGKFEDWRDRKVYHLGNDAPAIRIAALPHGMASGAASVMIGIELPDGSVVMAETSLRLFLAAARAFSIRYPDNDGWRTENS